MFAIKAWVVNPYRIPSASMEPTLHCAHTEQGDGCEASYSDRVLANRFIYHFRDPHRGEIVVFNTPRRAKQECGAGGTFVKRLIGLPGDVVREDEKAFLWINGTKLNEPYISAKRRDEDVTNEPVREPTIQGGGRVVGAHPLGQGRPDVRQRGTLRDPGQGLRLGR